MAKDEINAFLGTGTFFKGELNFQGAVRIDGTYSGTIQSQGTLIIGKDAKVDGCVVVDNLISSGIIDGQVYVSKKSVFHRTATFTGELNTAAVVIEEGAVLQGQMNMINCKTFEAKTQAFKESFILAAREDIDMLTEKAN